MLDFLVDHAVRNVWCTPDQDKQYIFKPQKVANPHGVINRVVVMNRSHNLPTMSEKYQVYQIGHYHPELIGLTETYIEKWVCLKDIANHKKLLANIYTDLGIELLREDCFYLWTNEKALLLAIKDNRKIVNLYSEEIYLRVYTNAYYKRSDINTDARLLIEFYSPITVNDILIAQNRFIYLSSLEGHTYVIVNGLYNEKLDLFTVKPGDRLEIVHDASVKEILDFKLADLKTFMSTRDKSSKYLIHPNKDGENLIDYMDDIDVYLISSITNRNFGIYIHKNNEQTFRMLTHRDYSLKVANVRNALLTLKLRSQNTIINEENTYVRLIVRNAGYNRPLVYEHTRIHELYKLPDDLIENIMLDSNNHLNEWRAANLENSNYVSLMNSDSRNIDKTVVSLAYGYNGVTKVAANSIIRVNFSEGVIGVNTPYLYTNESIVYEYDESGNFLGLNNHRLGSTYFCINSEAVYVEFLKGKAGINLETSFGVGSFTIRENVDYRVYMTEEYPYNQVTYNWRDVTNTDWYTVESNQITGKPGYYYSVRYEDRVLAYTFTDDGNKDVIEFDITEQGFWVNNYGIRPLMIPMGDLVVILNGKSLIEGIDYFVDFPTVRIVSKEYLLDTNRIHVRFSGFCSKDLKWNKSEDVGFVYHGKLSANNVFDIRDDRVLRTVVSGNLIPTDLLSYAEDGLTTDILNLSNGLPYEIRATYIPITNLTNLDSEELKIASRLMDKKISDYLSYIYPQLVKEEPSAAVNRYVLYSPFISRIIHDLVAGLLTLDTLSTNYQDTEIINLLKNYEVLLKTDPILDENRPDLDYVTIHPSVKNNVIELDLFSYRFLIRVVNIYAKDLIDLSPFIRLKEV